MGPPAPAATRVADAIVFTIFATVPLVATSAFWDQYVTVKSYVLEALAALWLLVEAWGCRSRGWPRLVRDASPLVLLLAALGLASVLRVAALAGPGPFAERLSVVALALCAWWYFRRNGSRLHVVRLATTLALAGVVAVGLAQAAGRDPLAELEASDGRGSTFGNANMAAQYAGLAVLLLVGGPAPRRRWRQGLDAFLAGATIGWLVVLVARSALLALAAGLIAQWLVRRRRGVRETVGVVALAAALVALAWWAGGRMLGPHERAIKEVSPEHRLAVWRDTLRLVADRPLGIGAGNFEDAFRPYQATGTIFADERQVFRHPHNEVLRIAAEEGVPFLAVLAVLLAGMAARLLRSGRGRPPTPARALLAGWSAFLLVESVFQFPFTLPFGALAACVLLGLALAEAEGDGARADASPDVAWRIAAAAVAVSVLVIGGRTAWSERLFVAARTDAAAQDRACRLDARNLPACVMAAWLRGAAGDLPGGRARLLGVLDRAPHYPPAMKLIAQQALVAGDRAAACVYLWTYDLLFRGQSSLHAEWMAWCDGAARHAAAQRVPSPHYVRFPRAGADAWKD